jgi:hypothetical protein
MDKVSNIPPQHPKGGQIFLISDGSNKARQNNWSCDGYPWVNKGGYGVPKNCIRPKIHILILKKR